MPSGSDPRAPCYCRGVPSVEFAEVCSGQDVVDTLPVEATPAATGDTILAKAQESEP